MKENNKLTREEFKQLMDLLRKAENEDDEILEGLEDLIRWTRIRKAMDKQKRVERLFFIITNLLSEYSDNSKVPLQLFLKLIFQEQLRKNVEISMFSTHRYTL